MIYRAFFLVLAAISGPAQAQQYRWVDPQGNVRYSDTPPPASAKNVQKLNIAAPKPAAPQQPFELTRLQKDFPVTLYTSPNCKEGCEMAREALNQRGVPFKEVQVWDPDSNEELKRVSGAAEVPTLLVGRSAQRGFERATWDALLDSAGYPKAGVLPARTQKAPDPPEGYVAPSERESPKALAEPERAGSPQKLGPYDPSTLKPSPPLKPGPYDPSTLKPSPPLKPGPYGTPADTR